MEDIEVRMINPIMKGRLTVIHRITIFEAIHKIKSLRWNTNKNIFRCLLNRILYETRTKNLLDLKLKIFHHILKHKVRVNEAFSSRNKIYRQFQKIYTVAYIWSKKLIFGGRGGRAGRAGRQAVRRLRCATAISILKQSVLHRTKQVHPSYIQVGIPAR